MNPRNLEKIIESAKKNFVPISVANNHFYEGWDTLLSAYGIDIILCETIGDYEGDHIYLLRLQNLWGFFVAGYGSCEGCDPIMGASEQEINEIARDLIDQISWYSIPQDLIVELNKRDGGNSWYCNEKEWGTVRTKFIDFLYKDLLNSQPHTSWEPF